MDLDDPEIIVIGAGLSGIAFARFYLDTHPYSKLLILEQDNGLGGVWSEDRVFDDFWVQSPLRMSSFSDFKLEIPNDAESAYSTFPAKFVTRYLEEYVNRHIYSGKSLRDRIYCNAKVIEVAKDDSKWCVMTHFETSGKREIRCDKVAVATGLTTQPFLPPVLREAEAGIEILHHRTFGRHADRLLAPDSGQEEFVVVGGGKSAADMVYAAARAGKKTAWIIRGSGEGPGIFLNPASTARYDNNAVQAGSTRAATALNPSAFRSPGWWAELHHKSEVGRSILRQRIDAVDQKCKSYADYSGRKGALPDFRHLEPTASFFWSSGPVGLIQKDDFWELISQKVSVYRADIWSVAERQLFLSDGRSIRADVVLCGTGWDAGYPFLANGLTRYLGLPFPKPRNPLSPETEREDELWEAMISDADQRIIAQFPILDQTAIAPSQEQRKLLQTPAKLYRGIAPLTDSTILFLGRSHMANNFRGSEAQAIWATAFWDGLINMPSQENLRKDVAYHIAFSRRRYPTRGADGVNVHSDLIWYTDTLLIEAGLKSHRKLWWSNWDEPILASDFEHCTEEYTLNASQSTKGIY